MQDSLKPVKLGLAHINTTMYIRYTYSTAANYILCSSPTW